MRFRVTSAFQVVSLLIGCVALHHSAALAADSCSVKPRPSGGSGGKHGTFPNESIEVGETERLFRLVVPDSVDLVKPATLVFAFHGFLFDSKDHLPRYTHLPGLAKREGFILVFPGGLGRRWRLHARRNIDLDFFGKLFDHVTSRYKIDLNRVYVVGMSNGAYFTNLVASAQSEKIAAIAAHSGGLGILAQNGVRAKRKYPVMLIHGDQDKIVPVEQSRQALGIYEQEGHKVHYVEIKGMRHFWASHAKVNDQIWKFFVENPMRPQ